MEIDGIIKVKLWNKYRRCTVRKVYPDGLFIDVLVQIHETRQGMPSFFQKIPISLVRKSDMAYVKSIAQK